MSVPESPLWTVAHIEDDEDVLRQVKEYLEGESFAFGKIGVVGLPSFDDGLDLLQSRKVDVIILDVFRGRTEQGDRAGLDLLSRWQETGFAPVILHTALPEGLEDVSSIFVRVVGKEAESLKRLADALNDLFAINIPQIHRAIVEHLDASLRAYMWGFVVKEWDKIKGLIGEPDFVRLLLRRLGVAFARGIGPMLERLYPGSGGAEPAPEKIHAVEYYVKPPIEGDLQLGDLRRLTRGGKEGLFVVLWPSCDLVPRDGHCKVERVLCARTKSLDEFAEYKKWLETEAPSANATNGLLDLMANNRRTGQADRYHFLPPAWDLPALVVDFADLDHVTEAELRGAPCVATLASPFAESVAVRFVRYLGRLGTPDLDLELILASFRPGPPSGT